MSVVGKPVRIDAVPFGPDTMWLPNPRDLGSRKIRRRYHEIFDSIEQPALVSLVMSALPSDEEMRAHVAAPLDLEVADVKGAAMLAGVVGLHNSSELPSPWVEPAVQLAIIWIAMDTYPVEQRSGSLLEWLVRVFFVLGLQGMTSWDESWPFIDECIALALPVAKPTDAALGSMSKPAQARPRPKGRR